MKLKQRMKPGVWATLIIETLTQTGKDTITVDELWDTAKTRFPSMVFNKNKTSSALSTYTCRKALKYVGQSTYQVINRRQIAVSSKSYENHVVPSPPPPPRTPLPRILLPQEQFNDLFLENKLNHIYSVVSRILVEWEGTK